ncbi:MAG: hypothetical protein ABI554_12270 [Flavobacterium sp.]
MRKMYILIALIYICKSEAQEKNKLQIKSIDYGAIGIYTGLENNGIKGFCSNIGLVSNYNKNLYSLNYALGFGITEKGDKIHDLQGFMSVDLLYGREIKVSKGILFEPYVGLGYIIQSNTSDAGGNSAIALPMNAKLLFIISKKFAMGLNPNVNINNVNTIYSANIFLRFGFSNFK